MEPRTPVLTEPQADKAEAWKDGGGGAGARPDERASGGAVAYAAAGAETNRPNGDPADILLWGEPGPEGPR